LIDQLPKRYTVKTLPDFLTINPGESRHVIAEILNGHEYPIQKAKSEELLAALELDIGTLAKWYGGRQQLDDVALRECMDILFKNYQHFGPLEIRQAFQLFSIGELGELKAGEAFYGQFGPRQLGAILSAYDRYRTKLLERLRKDKVRADYEARLKEKEQRAREAVQNRKKEFAQRLGDDIIKFAHSKSDWTAIPFYWTDPLYRWGLLNVNDDESEQIRTMALDHLEREIKLSMASNTGNQSTIKEALNKWAESLAYRRRYDLHVDRLAIFIKVILPLRFAFWLTKCFDHEL
jgi:hypothetical protein